MPDYVVLTDIEVIGPGDLSYLKLTPGMTEPHRKEYTVRDAVLTGEETPFDLWVKAVDGTEGMYKVVILQGGQHPVAGGCGQQVRCQA